MLLRPLVSAWFQGLFTPLLGVLFTFPSRYWFTIGLQGVFSLARWCWHIQTEFLRFRPTHIISIYILCTGLSPSLIILSRIFHYKYKDFGAVPRSLATTCGITNCFMFLQVLRCFSSLRLLTPKRVYGLQPYGFPHSDICGSKIVCISPQLIAAYHVLRSLLEPRHPPYALIRFLIFS